MYDTHAQRIACYAQSSPDALAHVMEFVILTIRMPLHRIPKDMAELRKRGAKSRNLWGWKREAWQNVQAHKAAIFADAMEMYRHPDAHEAERQLLAYFAAMPGFGLAKGGFVVQLAFGLGGCLDSHNVERFGLRANDIAAKRFKGAKTWETRYRLIDVYQDLLQRCGGCKGLWDDWCNYVAANQPNQYRDGHHVSALHCEALGLSVA